MSQCYKCKTEQVSEEFQRCPPCEQEHQALAKELDSRPRTKEKKVKEKLYPIKEIKNGIEVTTYIDRSDAVAMGIKV